MNAGLVTEREVVALLERDGPLRGAQLLERTGGDARPLWRVCRQSDRVLMYVAGRRYLRLDRVVEGFARLSPSIRREFLTYTVLGTREQAVQMKMEAGALRAGIERISETKCALAQRAMKECVEELPEYGMLFEHACFIIAGDVTYGMGHDVPRPERSTGRMVRGSDLDIIVVVDDEMPENLVERLDDAILKKKHYFLVHPDLREELDYLIKPVSRVREQLHFDTFEHMVACKILHEGLFLLGSSAVFKTVKELVGRYGIPGRLEELSTVAVRDRENAERCLLSPSEKPDDPSFLDLFYTREEGDEIY